MPDDLIPLADLPSTAKVAPSAARADPYHQRLWPSGGGGATVAWGGRSEMEAWGSSFALSRKSCADAYFSLDRSRRVAALAALQMWRLATTEQLAALTGDPRWLSPRWPQALVLADLAGAGSVTFRRSTPVVEVAPVPRRRRRSTGTP